MIISRTPFRLSFVGGGSDLPAFCDQRMGAVLSVTLDRSMYLSAHPFHDADRIHLRYSKSELVSRPEDVAHPIVREALGLCGVARGIEISSSADVPAGTGLGSSSTFTVGLLHVLAAYQGKHVSREQLASTAAHIEIDRLGEPIGRQDHYAAAFGGLNVIEFHPHGVVRVEPVCVPPSVWEALQARLLMFSVGDQRDTRTVLADQSRNVAEDRTRFDATCRMVDLVFELRDALYAGNLSAVGPLLHRNWEIKRGLSARISNAGIDDAYSKALAAGATGGKLLGAGGGGFLAFYVEPERQVDVRAALGHLREMPVRFDASGSRIIFTDGAGAPPWTSQKTSILTFSG